MAAPNSRPTQLSTDATSAQMLRVAASFGFMPVAESDLPQARAIASALMGCEIASAATFLAVMRMQPAACLALKDGGDLTALAAAMWLRPAAVAQIMEGRFDATCFDLELLSRGEEIPAAGYGWGIAATTKAAGMTLRACTSALRLGPLSPFDFFSRAVTPVGRHVCITRSGYRPLRSPDDDWLFRPAAGAERLVA